MTLAIRALGALLFVAVVVMALPIVDLTLHTGLFGEIVERSGVYSFVVFRGLFELGDGQFEKFLAFNILSTTGLGRIAVLMMLKGSKGSIHA